MELIRDSQRAGSGLPAVLVSVVAGQAVSRGSTSAAAAVAAAAAAAAVTVGWLLQLGNRGVDHAVSLFTCERRKETLKCDALYFPHLHEEKKKTTMRRISSPFWECVGVWKSVRGLSLQDGALLSVLLLLVELSCAFVAPAAALGTSLNICDDRTV